MRKNYKKLMFGADCDIHSVPARVKRVAEGLHRHAGILQRQVLLHHGLVHTMLVPAEKKEKKKKKKKKKMKKKGEQGKMKKN